MPRGGFNKGLEKGLKAGKCKLPEEEREKYRNIFKKVGEDNYESADEGEGLKKKMIGDEYTENDGGKLRYERLFGFTNKLIAIIELEKFLLKAEKLFKGKGTSEEDLARDLKKIREIETDLAEFAKPEQEVDEYIRKVRVLSRPNTDNKTYSEEIQRCLNQLNHQKEETEKEIEREQEREKILILEKIKAAKEYSELESADLSEAEIDRRLNGNCGIVINGLKIFCDAKKELLKYGFLDTVGNCNKVQRRVEHSELVEIRKIVQNTVNQLVADYKTFFKKHSDIPQPHRKYWVNSGLSPKIPEGSLKTEKIAKKITEIPGLSETELQIDYDNARLDELKRTERDNIPNQAIEKLQEVVENHGLSAWREPKKTENVRGEDNTTETYQKLDGKGIYQYTKKTEAGEIIGESVQEMLFQEIDDRWENSKERIGELTKKEHETDLEMKEKKLERKLTRKELQKAIEEKVSLGMFGGRFSDSKKIKEKIQTILHALQDLIPQDNNSDRNTSITGNDLSPAQINAYILNKGFGLSENEIKEITEKVDNRDTWKAKYPNADGHQQAEQELRETELAGRKAEVAVMSYEATHNALTVAQKDLNELKTGTKPTMINHANIEELRAEFRETKLSDREILEEIKNQIKSKIDFIKLNLPISFSEKLVGKRFTELKKISEKGQGLVQKLKDAGELPDLSEGEKIANLVKNGTEEPGTADTEFVDKKTALLKFAKEHYIKKVEDLGGFTDSQINGAYSEEEGYNWRDNIEKGENIPNLVVYAEDLISKIKEKLLKKTTEEKDELFDEEDNFGSDEDKITFNFKGQPYTSLFPEALVEGIKNTKSLVINFDKTEEEQENEWEKQKESLKNSAAGDIVKIKIDENDELENISVKETIFNLASYYDYTEIVLQGKENKPEKDKCELINYSLKFLPSGGRVEENKITFEFERSSIIAEGLTFDFSGVNQLVINFDEKDEIYGSMPRIKYKKGKLELKNFVAGDTVEIEGTEAFREEFNKILNQIVKTTECEKLDNPDFQDTEIDRKLNGSDNADEIQDKFPESLRDSVPGETSENKLSGEELTGLQFITTNRLEVINIAKKIDKILGSGEEDLNKYNDTFFSGLRERGDIPLQVIEKLAQVVKNHELSAKKIPRKGTVGVLKKIFYEDSECDKALKNGWQADWRSGRDAKNEKAAEEIDNKIKSLEKNKDSKKAFSEKIAKEAITRVKKELLGLIKRQNERFFQDIVQKIVKSEIKNITAIPPVYASSNNLRNLLDLQKVIKAAQEAEKKIRELPDSNLQIQIEGLKKYQEHYIKKVQQKARQDLQTKIEKGIKESRSLSFRDIIPIGKKDTNLTNIQTILHALQTLIPKDNNPTPSPTDNAPEYGNKKLSPAQIAAYAFNQEKADARELVLLKMEAVFVDHEKELWGFTLSEKEKGEIEATGVDKKKLIEIQKNFRLAHNPVEGPNKAEEVYKNALAKDAEVRNIEDGTQKKNWKIVAGSTAAIKNAEIIWNNGWREIKGTAEKPLNENRMSAFGHGFSNEVKPLTHRREDVDKVLELYSKLNVRNGSITNLTDLRNNINLNNLGYAEEYVPNEVNYDKIRECEEAKNDYCRACLALPNLALAKNGVSEREIVDNEIVNNLNINPYQVKKQTLDLARDLLMDINNKTSSTELSPYPRFGEITGLLPAEGGLDETDLPVDNTEEYRSIEDGDGNLVFYAQIEFLAANAEKVVSLVKNGVLAYYQNGIPADRAPIIASYISPTSGEIEPSFDGVKVERGELEKVNAIIREIEGATLSGIKNREERKNIERITKYNEAKQKQKEAKVKPDITEIENELNQKPVILARDLTNSNYRNQLINLADRDSERKTYKQTVIAEITQKRNDKLAQVRQIIANAQIIFAKTKPTKVQLEKAVNDLKTLTQAAVNSAENLVWKEKESENQKLLTDLEGKLSKFVPPRPTPLPLPQPENLPPPPTPNAPLTPKQKEVYENQRKSRQEVVQKWEEVKQEIQRETLAEIQACQKVCALPQKPKLSEECQKPENERIVGIYFSPNRGGNRHAPLSYAETVNPSSLILEKDNQGEIYQEHSVSNIEPIN
ncbi:12445_t:CDS:10 [Funneliformis geosporum]|uniref:12445_t:CDS:1 n=1 Tax=Funneliformis geosporum TaxID=1117311 RepID=A0A9W4SAX8_9GLOM|nr:12445_t:CDS:10 [Funneliformis geosporum]